MSKRVASSGLQENAEYPAFPYERTVSIHDGPCQLLSPSLRLKGLLRTCIESNKEEESRQYTSHFILDWTGPDFDTSIWYSIITSSCSWD